ncbi:MAG: type III secretion system chaperone [Desulfobacterales bacterium]|nr:type III secretion system chaperone [Desulfobacterales bacterium]
MELKEQAQKILNFLTREGGVADAVLDGDGRAVIPAMDMVFIFYLSPGTQAMETAIYVGKPDLGDSHLLYRILCGNHLWEYTGGGQLSLDRETGHLCLTTTLDLPVTDWEGFGSAWGEFLGAARYWQDVLSGYSDQPAASEIPGAHFIRV